MHSNASGHLSTHGLIETAAASRVSIHTGAFAPREGRPTTTTEVFMPYMRRMLVDGIIAMSIALAFLFEWYGKDHKVLMTAMSVFTSTSAIDYGTQSPNARLFIARFLAMSIGLFAMMTGTTSLKSRSGSLVGRPSPCRG